MRLLALLLLAAPLSAQQTVVYPDVQIENTVNVEPTPIEITVMSDSVMLANLNRNLEALREQIAEQECNTCGGSDVVRIGQGALVLIAAFMAWQVKKIADKPPNVHNDGDVTVPVTVEAHDHEKKHEHDDSESES